MKSGNIFEPILADCCPSRLPLHLTEYSHVIMQLMTLPT